MSRGLGKVQVIIQNMFQNSRKGWYATRELCEAVYGRKDRYTKDEHKVVKRAAKAVALKMDWRVMYAKVEASTNFYFSKRHLLLEQQEDMGYSIMQAIADKYLKHKVVPKLVHKAKLRKYDMDPDEIAIEFIRFMQEKLTDAQKRTILYEQYYNYLQSQLKTMDLGELITKGLERNKLKKAIIEGLEEITVEELKGKTHLYLIDDMRNEDDNKSDSPLTEAGE